MPGQLIQRGDKTWLIRVFVGRDPQTGKRQYHNQTFYGGRKQAGDALLDALRDAKQGKLTPAASKTTIGELLDALHRDYKVNDKSHEWVGGVVRMHLKPYLGKIPSAKLTFDLVQRYVERRQGERATNATINREISLLRRAFNLCHHTLPPLPSS